jgi:hypothetical protein
MMIRRAETVDPRRKSGTIPGKTRAPYARSHADGRHRQRRNRQLPLWWQLLNLAFRNVS